MTRCANSGCEQSQQKNTTRSPRRRRQAAQAARSGRAHARRLVVKLAAETPEMGKFPVNFPVIPALRDDPKIVGRDDTKVVGDSVAKAVPFFGNSSPEEAQDCRSELREGFIASVPRFNVPTRSDIRTHRLTLVIMCIHSSRSAL